MSHPRTHTIPALHRPTRAAAVALVALTVALTLAFSAAVRPLAAQSRPTDDGPGHAVTFNPFTLLAGWVAGEYEQRVNPSLTMGGAVNYFDYSDDRYTTFEFKTRLYASEHAMRGFSISGGIGIAHLSFIDRDASSLVVITPGCNNNCGDVRKTATTPTFGIELGYQWMLGRSGHTAINTGFGATRFLASKSTLSGTDRVIPTFRLGIGYGW